MSCSSFFRKGVAIPHLCQGWRIFAGTAIAAIFFLPVFSPLFAENAPTGEYLKELCGSRFGAETSEALSSFFLRSDPRLHDLISRLKGKNVKIVYRLENRVLEENGVIKENWVLKPSGFEYLMVRCAGSSVVKSLNTDIIDRILCADFSPRSIELIQMSDILGRRLEVTYASSSELKEFFGTVEKHWPLKNGDTCLILRNEHQMRSVALPLSSLRRVRER